MSSDMERIMKSNHASVTGLVLLTISSNSVKSMQTLLMISLCIYYVQMARFLSCVRCLEQGSRTGITCSLGNIDIILKL
jgi:hypothetical protein